MNRRLLISLLIVIVKFVGVTAFAQDTVSCAEQFEKTYFECAGRKRLVGAEVRKAVSTKRLALSTNVVDWAWCVTPNIAVQYAVSQHWTVTADVKYNRWSFNDDSVDGRIRQARKEYAIGVRWWGWYAYSGWWAGVKMQYREYSGNGILGHNVGLWSDRYIKEEGDEAGLAISFGYSIQVSRWFDVDLGLGVWGGRTWYKQYSGVEENRVCPRFGRRIDAPAYEPASQAWFFGPNEVIVSAKFIF